MTTTKLQQVVVLSTLLAAAALAPLTVHGAVDINLGVPCPKQCGSKANNTVYGDNHCCSGDGFCGLGGLRVPERRLLHQQPLQRDFSVPQQPVLQRLRLLRLRTGLLRQRLPERALPRRPLLRRREAVP